MTDLLLKNARLVLADRIAPGSVLVEGDRVSEVFPANARLPSARSVLDLDGRYLAPGFVDLHIHGAAGVDVQSADDAELDRMAGWLAGEGVTRFVPTLVPAPLDEL